MTSPGSPEGLSQPLVRTAVLWLAVVVSLQTRSRNPELLMPVLLAGGLVLVLVLVCGRRRERSTTQPLLSPLVPAAVLVGFGLLISSSVMLDIAEASSTTTLVVMVALATSCLGAVLPGRASLPSFAAFVGLSVSLGLVYLTHVSHHSDVLIYLRDATGALVRGHDPYALTFPNPYSPEETSSFFGPGLVVGDRLDFGFPYLPGVLLGYLPTVLLGDARVVTLLALAVTTVLLRRQAPSELGRLLAMVPLTLPVIPKMLEMAWVEPALMVFLVWTVAAMAAPASSPRRGVGSALGLGLLLASKQYLVVVAPLLLLLARGSGARTVVRGVGVAAVLIGVFLAWNPHAFVRSVVELHLQQPYRADSISLVVAWGNTFGQLPAWSYGVLPLGVGMMVSALLAWRAPAGAASFSLGVGLSLLATVLLSKQAFGNYFAFIAVALVAAVVAGFGEAPRGGGEDAVGEDAALPADPDLVEQAHRYRGH